MKRTYKAIPKRIQDAIRNFPKTWEFPPKPPSLGNHRLTFVQLWQSCNPPRTERALLSTKLLTSVNACLSLLVSHPLCLTCFPLSSHMFPAFISHLRVSRACISCLSLTSVSHACGTLVRLTLVLMTLCLSVPDTAEKPYPFL